MEDMIYIVKIGMHSFLATDQDHALQLIRLLAPLQSVNCSYTVESGESVTHTKPASIALEVKSLDVMDGEHL
ncbi:hypothetical protein ACH42_17300 [Endozoicomonas sp. (ex Bugula neritina AB1)]|nr:hypothetical protein ACH42_17300 [Endozoicomonas sp. (ex Bugula neritina AB1)]